MKIIDNRSKGGSLTADPGDVLVGGNRYLWVTLDEHLPNTFVIADAFPDKSIPEFKVWNLRTARRVYTQVGGDHLDLLTMANFKKEFEGLKVDKNAKWVL